MKRIERTFAGRQLVLEAGRMARQAHGSCMVQYGESAVLCTVVAHDAPTHLPFFPLTVEYRERSYAAGKIPGGFFKREGRPGEAEILSARLVDRTIRPMFPDGFMHETQIMAHVLAADQQNDADVLAILGASACLCMSKIPFAAAVAAVRIGRIQGQWILNPTFQQLEFSDVEIVVAGTEDAILMVEGGAVEIPEEDLVEGLIAAHDGIKELISIQRELLDGISVPKMTWTRIEPSDVLRERVQAASGGRLEEAMRIADKAERSAALASLREEVVQELLEEFPEEGQMISELLSAGEKDTMRRQIVEKGVRADGRRPDDIRPIACEVKVLPRTHGSAL
ncbi:MAG: polyribonucleotide nucleotidyltransferase, partial [Longimicrobiales bacterium]